MSSRIGNLIIIRPLEDSICEDCGKKDECRPYGKGGQSICYDCGIKIPEIVEHNMNVQLFGMKGDLI